MQNKRISMPSKSYPSLFLKYPKYFYFKFAHFFLSSFACCMQHSKQCLSRCSLHSIVYIQLCINFGTFRLFCHFVYIILCRAYGNRSLPMTMRVFEDTKTKIIRNTFSFFVVFVSRYFFILFVATACWRYEYNNCLFKFYVNVCCVVRVFMCSPHRSFLYTQASHHSEVMHRFF